MIKLKFKSAETFTEILDLLINQIFFINSFIIFYTYIKISKDSSDEYYLDNKERLQEKLLEDIKVFLKKKKKKKCNNMAGNDTKIYQKVRNKSWLNIEKILKNEKKRLTTISIRNKKLFIFSSNYKILFLIREFCFFFSDKHKKIFHKTFSLSVKTWFFS